MHTLLTFDEETVSLVANGKARVRVLAIYVQTATESTAHVVHACEHALSAATSSMLCARSTKWCVPVPRCGINVFSWDGVSKLECGPGDSVQGFSSRLWEERARVDKSVLVVAEFFIWPLSEL